MSRARPPGLAAADEDRNLTYSAALQQAEELLSAARSSGWASRPLPLFYSLSQAGRAVAAAVAPDGWELHGHGLRIDFDPDVMESRVSPHSTGSFPRMCELFGCHLSGSVSLANVWGALPDLVETPAPTAIARPLYIEHVEDEYPMSAVATPLRAAIVFPPNIDADGHEKMLASYPAVSNVQLTTESRETFMGHGRVIWWPGRLNPKERFHRIRELVAIDESTRGGWLVPGVGEAQELLSPLLLWWVLLFGFSMLARYEPRRWRALLDVDTSAWAVPVESALDIGIEVLPRLVLSALSLANG